MPVKPTTTPPRLVQSQTKESALVEVFENEMLKNGGVVRRQLKWAEKKNILSDLVNRCVKDGVNLDRINDTLLFYKSGLKRHSVVDNSKDPKCKRRKIVNVDH